MGRALPRSGLASVPQLSNHSTKNSKRGGPTPRLAPPYRPISSGSSVSRSRLTSRVGCRVRYEIRTKQTTVQEMVCLVAPTVRRLQQVLFRKQNEPCQIDPPVRFMQECRTFRAALGNPFASYEPRRGRSVECLFHGDGYP
ncbi:MAG: hypothetical protein JWN34_2347 [Bryobacterales bacterium]|nr:hypothetical protein [Bryobacterales bacterium]